MTKSKSPNLGLKKDHTGRIFGRLTVIKRLSKDKAVGRKYTAYWCKCSCGNELEIRGCQLVTGNTKSCGCYAKELCRSNPNKIVNLVGQRFTRLVALERIQLPKRGVVYRCLCDCSKEVTVSSSSLNSKNSKSCGCLNIDKIIERNHDPKLIMKRVKSVNQCYTEKHWKSGKELMCKGSWEHSVVLWLNTNKIDFTWQVPFRLSDGRTYIVDLYLRKQRIYVEIKGWWRDDAKAKHDLFKSDNPKLKVETWGIEELKARHIPIRRPKQEIL